MDYAGGENQADLHIPVDLFISKKTQKGLSHGFNLQFTDSSGNLVFTVDRPRSPYHQRVLFDSSGNPLISIARNQKESWQGFRKDSSEGKDTMFKVERTQNTLARTEFEVFLVNGDLDNPKFDFKMKGCPFYRSCTIYKGDSVVAQTSLMYKLGIQKVLVPRNRFRLTIFPGFADHAFIVALTVIFFYGRKLWI